MNSKSKSHTSKMIRANTEQKKAYRFDMLNDSESEQELEIVNNQDINQENNKENKEVKNENIIEKKEIKSETKNKEDDGEWQSINKKNKKYNKKELKSRNKVIRIRDEDNEEKGNIIIEDSEEEDTKIIEGDNKDGSEYKFKNVWYVWVHEIESKDWSPQSYKIIYTIDNISNFISTALQGLKKRVESAC